MSRARSGILGGWRAGFFAAVAAIAFTAGNSAQAQEELMPDDEILIRVDSKTHNSITITARGMQPGLSHPNDPNNPQVFGYIREKPSGACPDATSGGNFDRPTAGSQGYKLFTRLVNARRINDITNWKIPADTPDAGAISTPLMPNTEYCILVATATSRDASERRHLIITETTEADTSTVDLELTGGVLQFTAAVDFSGLSAFNTPIRLWLRERDGADCGGANVDADGNLDDAHIAHHWTTDPSAMESVTITHRGTSTTTLTQGTALTAGFYCAQIISADPTSDDGKSAITQVEVTAPPPEVMLELTGGAGQFTAEATFTQPGAFDLPVTLWLRTRDGASCPTPDANGNIPGAFAAHQWTAEPPASDTVTITHLGTSFTSVSRGAALTAGFYCAQIISAAPASAHGRSMIREVEVAPPPPEPVAMAEGPSAAVAEGATVTLTAMGTTDPQGVADLQYAWTQVDGASSTDALAPTHADYVGIPTASQSAPTPAMASITFTAPSHYTGGSNELHFRLQVTDPQGNTDDAHVTVMVTGANTPPTTPVITTVMHTPPVAGASAMVLPAGQSILPSVPAIGDTAAMNSQVVLSVTADDPDTGDSVMTYNWTLVTEARGTNAVSTGHELAAFSQTLERAPSRSLADGGGTLPAGRTLSFNAPAFVDANGMPAGLGCESPAEGDAVCPARTTPLMLHFRVTATDDNTANSESAWVTIAVAAPPSGNSEVVDRAILPHVIRALERQVHNSIYQRIQQRQRQDGRWK